MATTFRPVVHMVWFKTKPGVTREALDNLFKGMNELRKIPGVISVDYGNPCLFCLFCFDIWQIH